jgi:hypothetical protein
MPLVARDDPCERSYTDRLVVRSASPQARIGAYGFEQIDRGLSYMLVLINQSCKRPFIEVGCEHVRVLFESWERRGIIPRES